MSPLLSKKTSGIVIGGGVFGLLGLLAHLFEGLSAIELWPLAVAHLGAVSLGRHIYLTAFRTALLVFLLMGLWSYRVEGVVFGEGFFVHAHLNTVMFMGFYPVQTLATGVALIFHCLIELKVIKHSALWRVSLNRFGTVSLILMAGLVLSPLPRFCEQLFLPREANGVLPTHEQAAKTLMENAIAPEELFPDLSPLSIENRRNLLVFYLESLEAQYLNENRFPGLMPFLNETRAASVFFSNFKQNTGTFTISGMFASQCGYPFEIFSDESEMNKTLFYQGTHHLTCFGDVMGRLGYQQVFIQGTSLDFAGTRQLFEAHQYHEIIGSEDLTGSVKPYAVFRDKPLYGRVVEKIKELKKRGRPYHIASINFDTHDPGHTDASCVPYANGEDAILNSVHCLDQHLKSLFVRLEEEQLMENTVFVFLSDHLAMTRFKGEAGRRNLLMIHDPSRPAGKAFSQEIYHHDVPNILFDKLRINGGPYYPLAFSPLSEKKRNLQPKEELLKSIARVFKDRQTDQLPCDATVSFHYKKNRLTYNDRTVHFSPGHGVLTWPRDRIAVVAVAESGRILFKELIYASDVMLRLTHPQVYRVLLWGHLDQLEAFEDAAHAYGYFWGRLNQPKEIQPLNPEKMAQMQLKCGLSR